MCQKIYIISHSNIAYVFFLQFQMEPAHGRSLPCYAILIQKIKLGEANPSMTLVHLHSILKDDIEIDWDAIRTNEKKLDSWNTIAPHWKLRLIGALHTTGRFVHGGDRTSTRFRGAKQQAIVEYVEKETAAAPLVEDDDTVVDRCLDRVERQWKVADPNGLTVVRRVVRTVYRTCSCRLRKARI